MTKRQPVRVEAKRQQAEDTGSARVQIRLKRLVFKDKSKRGRGDEGMVFFFFFFSQREIVIVSLLKERNQKRG